LEIATSLYRQLSYTDNMHVASIYTPTTTKRVRRYAPSRYFKKQSGVDDKPQGEVKTATDVVGILTWRQVAEAALIKWPADVPMNAGSSVWRAVHTC